MADTDTIAAGAAAWRRLRDRDRATWPDWLAVGESLVFARAECMNAAKTNRPVGKRYNAAMTAWLAANDMAEINASERYLILKCLANIKAIDAWRASLTDAQRRRVNHPGACWHKWRRSCRANEPKPAPAAVEKIAAAAAAARVGRPIYWSQDSVRRAHRAMLDCRSNDLLTLARCALQAAIRSEADLIQLLAEPAQQQPVKSQPRRQSSHPDQRASQDAAGL